MSNNLASSLDKIEVVPKYEVVLQYPGLSNRHIEAGPHTAGDIGIIESRAFLRECIRRSMQSAFPGRIVAYSNFSDLEMDLSHSTHKAVLLSLVDGTSEGARHALNVLSEIVSKVPIIIFSCVNDLEQARTSIAYGAKGYIPATMGFDIVVEAVKFVVAGGTYVPMDYFFAKNRDGAGPSKRSATQGAVTVRELAVVRAIQQGKSNKVIAYDLNMCESTVKVHVRNIMKKLKARNRTEVAIMTKKLDTCQDCVSHSECWSNAVCLERLEIR